MSDTLDELEAAAKRLLAKVEAMRQELRDDGVCPHCCLSEDLHTQPGPDGCYLADRKAAALVDALLHGKENAR